MKTIQFCGDSFCAGTVSTSYTVLLSEMLNANMIGRGRSGSAHEHAIRTFNTSADYTVFCWTDSQRLFLADEERDINLSTAERYLKDTDDFRHTKTIAKAAFAYFRYIGHKPMQTAYNKQRQMRDLYWFDHEVLSKSDSKIIHYFNKRVTYQFKHGYQMPGTIHDDFNIPSVEHNPHYYNHLSEENNKILAETLYNKFTDPLLFT